MPRRKSGASTAAAKKRKLKDEEKEEDEEEVEAPKRSKRAASKKASAAVKQESSDAEEEEEVKPKAKGHGKSAAAAKSKGKGKSTKSRGRGKAKKEESEPESEEEEEEDEGNVCKGRAPVDPECTSKLKSAHVYEDGDDIYDAMLNQTNIGNNNNKYFIIQLLEDDARKAYSVWFRWGRVGYRGQMSLVPCGSNLESAKNQFKKKFHDKTRNVWENRTNFRKSPGKYDLVAIDYEAKEEKEEKETEPTEEKDDEDKVKKEPDSELDERLQALLKLIADIKTMENAVVEMKYDAKKAPLGKLTKEQIKAGYESLKIIDDCISRNQMSGAVLVNACNEFYTRIPHNFGMRVPPMIRTKEEVKQKIALLETLGDIEIAMKILKKQVSNENQIDTVYKDLHCALEPLEKDCDEEKMVVDYLQNTHAATHRTYDMEVMQVFKVNKDGEDERFKDFGNRQLLWHGSRLTNWVGILSQGLRIAPPEAPVTGYMFGKGVYFADMSSKSANYCFASKHNDTGILLLCEVSLGKCNELLGANYNAADLPKGTHSTHGMGKVAPDPKDTITLPDGVVVPMGLSKDTGVSNKQGYTLAYNEFIVYDVAQIRMRYLLKTKFKFKY